MSAVVAKRRVSAEAEAEAGAAEAAADDMVEGRMKMAPPKE